MKYNITCKVLNTWFCKTRPFSLEDESLPPIYADYIPQSEAPSLFAGHEAAVSLSLHLSRSNEMVD